MKLLQRPTPLSIGRLDYSPGICYLVISYFSYRAITLELVRSTYLGVILPSESNRRLSVGNREWTPVSKYRRSSPALRGAIARSPFRRPGERTMAAPVGF